MQATKASILVWVERNKRTRRAIAVEFVMIYSKTVNHKNSTDQPFSP
jgi:hypothetical protein